MALSSKQKEFEEFRALLQGAWALGEIFEKIVAREEYSAADILRARHITAGMYCHLTVMLEQLQAKERQAENEAMWQRHLDAEFFGDEP